MTDAVARQYTSLVWKIANRYYAPGLDAADLAQEGFVGLFNATRDFREGRGAFVSFAALCIERQIQTAVKEANRQKHRPLNNSVRVATNDDGEEIAALDLVGGGPSLEDVAEQRREAVGLLEAIATRLTLRERRAVVGFMAGLTYAEIAADAEIVRLKTIDNDYARGRRKLRDAA